MVACERDNAPAASPALNPTSGQAGSTSMVAPARRVQQAATRGATLRRAEERDLQPVPAPE